MRSKRLPRRTHLSDLPTAAGPSRPSLRWVSITLCRPAQDHVGRLLRDHDDRRVGVAGDQRWHDAAVDDAQSRRRRARATLASTTASGSAAGPILQVPAGWKIVPPLLFANSSRSSSVTASGPGRYSPATYGCERARCGKPPREPNACDDRRPVVRCRQVVWLHRRRRQRIGRLQADETARLGPQLTHRHRESGERVHR